jgi:short-subunit dehydrogenase
MESFAPRRTALVTGASAGIGQAFARVFAADGFDLVLVARREQRLQALAGEVAGRHGVEARVVVADLSDPASRLRIREAALAGGRHVDVLVNNAGYGLTGGFLDADWKEHARFIEVMMTAFAELVHLFLPGMLERRWGRIVNVASLAGLLPATAGHTLYAASKAFVVKFSESVAREVRPYNVNVTALCPGFTYTEMHDVNGMREQVSRLPGWMWMDAESVARDGYMAVMRGDIVRVPGRINRTIAVASRLLPQALVTAVMKRPSRRLSRTSAGASRPAPGSRREAG